MAPGRKKRPRRSAGRPRRLDFGLELAFELEVRQSPIPVRAESLAWLRAWRRRPGRVFWVMDGLGGWRCL